MERLFPNSHVLIANLNHYKDRPGGAGRLAWDEAHFLARNGHRVTLLAAATNPDQPESEMNQERDPKRQRETLPNRLARHYAAGLCARFERARH